MARRRKFDPYAILDVPKDADGRAVKAAYRRAAKATHPDAGGSAEEFGLVNRALKVLSDPKRRQHFDKTGEDEEPRIDGSDKSAMNFIMEMLKGCLVADNDPLKCDLVKDMQDFLDKDIAEQGKRLAKVKMATARAEKVAKRFRRRKGDNLISQMLTWQIGELRRTVAGIETGIETRKRAKEILAEYEFEFESDQFVVRAYITGSSTTSTSGG